MATSNNSWMPPPGRHSVTVAPTMRKALQLRKGLEPAEKGKHPRDFHTIRYNFRPSSVDSSQSGNLWLTKTDNSVNVTVEHPSTAPDEIHMFTGSETPAKEFECVLTYSEVSGDYVLEKMDSFINLDYTEKRAVSARPSASPMPNAAGSSWSGSSGSRSRREKDDVDMELEQLLPEPVIRHEEEEEEEEGEEGELPIRIVEVPKPKAQAKPKAKPNDTPPAPAPAPKPLPAPIKRAPAPSVPKVTTVPAAKAAPPVPAPTPKAAKPPPMKLPAAKSPAPKFKRVPKRELELPSGPHSDAEEEHLEFGRPAKRAHPSPPQPFNLELPDDSSFSLPSHHPLPKPSSSSSSYIAPLPAAAIANPEPSSDSEEDWDEVPAAAPISTSIIMDDGDVEAEGEEIDVMDFERMLNEHLEEEDVEEDFLAAAYPSELEPPPRPITGGPISLNKLAGGELSPDEDDYSSSDDSDDD